MPAYRPIFARSTPTGFTAALSSPRSRRRIRSASPRSTRSRPTSSRRRVMIATSGARLVTDETMAAIEKTLLPLATIMTPNLPEAEVLCGFASDPSASRAADSSRARELASRLHEKFGCAVLVKGGHGTGATAVDVLFDGKSFEEFSMPWIENPVSTHGTGCSLAAALAAELALGRDLSAAVRSAKAYVHDAIAGSYLVGKDCGVLAFAPRS